MSLNAPSDTGGSASTHTCKSEAEEALYALFVRAQGFETEGDIEAAVNTYESIVASAHSSKPRTYTSRKRPRDHPPPSLLASCSLTCIGGHYLDAEDIEEAKTRFKQASLCWSENVLAKINLANIEREWGDEEQALSYYRDVIRIAQRAEQNVVNAAMDDAKDKDKDKDTDTDAGVREEGKGKRMDEEMDTWREELVAGPRRVVVGMAHYLLAGMLHQRLEFEEALTHLKVFGFRYRLAPALWRTANNLLEAGSMDGGRSQVKRAPKESGIRLIRDAVDGRIASHLQEIFGVESPFWEGTDYHSRGYFSFHYDVSAAPSNAIEKIIKEQLLPLLDRQDIQVAEWWVHSRVCGRSLGHQLHFDTQEASLSSAREIHHPALSSVLYVSVLPNADPTVVLNQRVGEGPAEKAFVVPPSEASFLTFPGDLLHGVLPSAMANPTRHPRITLMVGFWNKPVSKLSALGPCGSLPEITSSCSWPTILQLPAAQGDLAASAVANKSKSTKQLGIIEVSSPWEEIQLEDSPAPKIDRLPVPEELDQRFYVHEMESFRAQLVERMLD